jgi:NAD(P)-dependent dehydrogenase (short-subunit alcohol dehydrogenase family)
LAANFDLNLVGGALFPCQVFGPAMKEQHRGSIINVASVSAHLPLSGVVAYSAAKAALLNLTLFLAREWAPNHVRVNSLTPGFSRGSKTAVCFSMKMELRRHVVILSHTPMARFGIPSELVGAAVFLASEKASGFVTGIDLRVDGGFLSQTI